MPPQGDVTLPATKRARKSLSGLSPSRRAGEKENATVDVSAASLAANRKKSRSKSIGPGGLDALKPANGNRRQSIAAPLPRSILKPTIPILPEIPPHKPKQATSRNEGDSTKVALRTEEEQQAAAREREERERVALEKEIKDRREARRKSLANRRVSFAAEATLHTFHEIEYAQDSTTSTDSTRRASSLAAPSPAPHATQQESNPAEPPSTPPEHVDDVVPDSPADQRELHQKKRRRSSGISPLDENDITMGSTVYDSDSDNGDDIIEDPDEGESDSDAGDGTMMTLDADEVTTTSAVSAGSMSMMSSDSTASIDEMLRLATQRAGARSAADEDEEVIPAFIGWGKKAAPGSGMQEDQEIFSSPVRSVVDEDDGMDMEETHAIGGIVRAVDADGTMASEGGMDMSMDMTHALGGIVAQKRAAQREATMCVDQTMDFTRPMGGIQSTADDEVEQQDSEGYEDMSMELTTVMGGVWATGAAKGGKPGARRHTTMRLDDADAEQTVGMDMTVGLGKIITTDKDDEGDGEMDMTAGMDMSPVALGGIIASVTRPADENEQTPQGYRSAEKAPPVNSRQSSPSRPSSPIKNSLKSILNRNPLPDRSPGRSPSRSPERSASNDSGIRKSPGRNSPAKPSIQTAKSPEQPRTPLRSSPSRFVASGSKSPVRSAGQNNKQAPVSPAKQRSPTRSLFQQDPATGATTPLVALTPQRRRLSGVGADRLGLGSPRVAELLERRTSIGEAAKEFSPGRNLELGRRGVKWDNPRIMEQEIDRQRQQEMDKEDGRKIMEREADERDVTVNLREMIQGLSPKKNPLRGRKSLHVGSAKGLLGKRPSELDDGEEEKDGVKRLKNHHGSPVKSIKLQQPPSKEETTGRLSKSSRSQDSTKQSLEVSTPKSPIKISRTAPSPRRLSHFRDVEDDGAIDLGRGEGIDAEDLDDDDEERISLQDFLNMTSIRFMELTTTKRRHTVAPQAKDNPGSDGKDDMSFERCVVAGACTVPMLELYQHSCRELKKYISEGRDIVREIESETLADNPPLFREYMSASPDFRVLMDNQFKNVKLHARLLSKAMWYEWRMKLQEGLKEGLDKTAEGMAQDEQVLKKKQALIDSTLPALVEKFAELEKEHGLLDEAVRELADCDPDELQAARDELLTATQDIDLKKQQIAELEQDLQQSEEAIGELTTKKQLCLNEIREAERVREECRGWRPDEIMDLRARVEAIEKEHGWTVTGCSDTTISMTYNREIELVFNPTSFAIPNSAASKQPTNIDLWYIAANRERDPVPVTTELEFFLQCIRDQVRALDQPRTSLRHMLDVVGACWLEAKQVSANIRSINCTFPTRVSRTSDTSMVVKATLLLSGLKTKVEVLIDLSGQSASGTVVKPRARVVYGQRFNEERMADFLSKEIGDKVGKGQMWGEVVVELYAKLLSGSNKQ
ncbi:hypothetical protein MCOR27_010690 [Pyricularia oryzae]|uniref:Spc7 kinetochore protein domain-containing protein n=2 Tax=Pyricularia TaxID=48558 RepID=A0ABQ8NJ77_PYRGI|nr:hypothetical protein MCOR01_005145 [Pyricularia oryzae]KAI6297401.1 hypothetical protein MCOR33_006236 [Pyricularia grisea]KAI6255765.1 hypothetical protein MCOR19_007728 [Pyricularia oryzae]KAI6265491.1 hypothetical protein MCOR26_010720 [Pyricularia oryzae]KAI6267202.1 hypothetical protein MCOR27_010690 [Pyricularia oryzae]